MSVWWWCGNFPIVIPLQVKQLCPALYCDNNSYPKYKRRKYSVGIPWINVVTIDNEILLAVLSRLYSYKRI